MVPGGTALRQAPAAVLFAALAMTNRTADTDVSAGSPADPLVIDWGRVHVDRLRNDLDPIDLLFARARAEHIHGLWIEGRQIVAVSRVIGINLPGLNDEMGMRTRDVLSRGTEFMAAVQALEPQLQGHYATAPVADGRRRQK